MRISQKDWKYFKHLTFPQYHNHLDACPKDNKPIVLGIVGGFSDPAALMVSNFCNTSKHLNVVSFFIDERYRKKGIGTQLLQETEEVAHQLGCQQLNMYYTTGSSGPEQFEKLALKSLFQGPVIRMVIGKSINKKMEPLWLNEFNLPKNVELFLWKNLSGSEKQQLINTQKRHNAFPQYLWPFQDQSFHSYEPINSLGIKRDGEVIGWLITHRIDKKTIRYSNICLHKDVQGLGYALPLLSEAINLHNKRYNDIPNSVFGVYTPNKLMLKFARRILMPYMTEIKESRVVYKELEANAALNDQQSIQISFAEDYY